MKTVAIQKQKEKADLESIAMELGTVANMLAKVLAEISNVETQNGRIILSAKAQRSIDRGLKDLKKGNHSVYKNFSSFKKAFA